MLMSLKEDNLIEELFIISSNRREGKGAQGKRNQFAKTFGKFPNTKIKVFVVAKAEGENKPHRWELIRDNYPDFDIFIDDNYYIIKSTMENFPSDKTYVLPDYKFSRSLQAPNIYHVKTTVSDLKVEDFTKAAEEYKTKKRKKQEQTQKTNWTPWLIGGGIILILVIGIIAFLWRKQSSKK
ncbi:MAG: hypothetical protein MRECE_22c025 [Mycoplasmataceae bacterium CE_OT135]|nr:MAG: hypothetical protein MRECE_22c025 [Mycoplasmataceae bacterium CE_OT135]